MSAPTVLVVTADDDYAADLVVQELHRTGTPVVRLNPGAGTFTDAELVAGRWRGTVGDGRRRTDLEEIVSVFWRWPDPPMGDPAIADEAARRWAAREDLLALYGILRSLPVGWVNHPDAADAAEHKPRQLAIAHRSGLVVPATRITSDGAAARTWIGDRRLLYKPFRADGADVDCMVIAGAASPDDLPDRLLSAGIYQEVADGTPVRLTRIGGQDFAARILGSPDLDWRPVQSDLTYEPVDVPPEVARGVTAYMRAFGLEYGAFDFIDTPAGWLYLECNPTGQYGFVEKRTGLPITRALADRLRTPVQSAADPVAALAQW